MVEKRIKGNHHPKWVIDKILQFHDEGMRSKDISKNSKEKDDDNNEKSKNKSKEILSKHEHAISKNYFTETFGYL